MKKSIKNAKNADKGRSCFDLQEGRVFDTVAGLFKSMDDGVFIFDKEEKPILINQAGLDLTGLSEKENSFDKLAKVFSKTGLDLKKKARQAICAGKTISVSEVVLDRMFFEVFITPINDSSKKVSAFAVILHDITKDKEVERMKTEFLALASHQIRTPLTALKLFVEMLVNEEVGPVNKKQRDYLENIQISTERMIKLINDLLNISRLESGRLAVKPIKTNLTDFIEQLIAEFEPLAKSHNCGLVFDKPKNQVFELAIDQTLMRQIIHNLITNAIQYAPAKRSDIVVSLSQDIKSNGVLISVKDAGIGIPKNDQKHIFEKFFRADNARKASTDGFGLGLYISKTILKMVNGRIWFESAGAGKGSVFHILLPKQGMKTKQGERGLAIVKK